MNVTVWGINYAPEVTGIGPFNTALCSFLRTRGHAVRMVTSFAYYPDWEKSAADQRRLFRNDLVDGVKVHRCWHYVPAKPRAITRMAHEASFVLTSFARLSLLPRPDLFVVVSPPLLLGLAAWLLSLMKRAPFVFHVQDLQPDAALELGLVRAGWFTRSLYWIESVAYRRAARVSGISRGMVRVFLEKKVPPEKADYFPNGIALPALHELPERGRFRQRQGYATTDMLVVYSGNLGVKQGLEILIGAARRIQNPRVQLVICGAGAQRDRLAEGIRRGGTRNLRLLPLLPEEQYRELLADADLTVITQLHGAGTFCFPSKLLNSLAFARPVLAVADAQSELAQAVEEGGFGIRVEPGQPEALAAAIESLAENPLQLNRMAKAGRRYVEQFDRDEVLSRFAEQLQVLIRGKASGCKH